MRYRVAKYGYKVKPIGRHRPYILYGDMDFGETHLWLYFKLAGVAIAWYATICAFLERTKYFYTVGFLQAYTAFAF